VSARSFWPPVEAAQVDYETLRARRSRLPAGAAGGARVPVRSRQLTGFDLPGNRIRLRPDPLLAPTPSTGGKTGTAATCTAIGSLARGAGSVHDDFPGPGPTLASSYNGRNVVERCFNRLKQWRGIAMRSEQARPQLPSRDLPRCDPDLDQDRLDQHGLEATGDYWRGAFYLLED
jgi:hypothetical protein